MAANKNNQAQMLMLLSQVTNLENQLRSSGMPQNQMQQNQMQQNQMQQNQIPLNQNSSNSNQLLAMMSQLNSLKGQNVNVKKNFKGRRDSPKSVPNLGSNIAGLLATLAGDNGNERGRCIWVTGLPEDYQNADRLINIFGNFGNIQRVKFTEKKPDGALIEYDDVRCCVKAWACLNKKKIDGSEIKVGFTKIDCAFLKGEDGKSKDVRKAKENWRYSKDGKMRKICMSRLRSLSNKLMVANLPEGKSDQLKKYLIESGFTVKSMEGSNRPASDDKPSNGYTMALVELESIEEVISAVGTLHNTWPKKFGAMKKDLQSRERGLVFGFAGVKPDKSDFKKKA